MHAEVKNIKDTAALAEHCQRLAGSPWLAVDTEFERVNTYYPELCLLQVANAADTLIIDPLAISDLDPLFALLYDPGVIKVFHAARQDLELFYHLRGDLPEPVHDTQIAAALCGFDQQIGYANLVREVLEVELPKTQTRTNWKQRPLSPQQIDYAADDVIYLGRLYTELHAKLGGAGKSGEFEQQCLALHNPALYEPDPETLWRRLKHRAVKQFNARQKNVLKQLTAWREITARTKNRPRKWILKDHLLVEMARQLPADRAALADIDGLSDRLIDRHGRDWLSIIHG